MGSGEAPGGLFHGTKPMVDTGRKERNRLRVDGTPFLFISGLAISGGVGLAELKRPVEHPLEAPAVRFKELRDSSVMK